jgi:hypothetical protein
MKMRQKIRRLVAVLVVIGGGVVGAVAAPATPAHASNCYDGWLKSVANGKYVSAQLDYKDANYGMLRARASRVDRWERFEFCWGTDTQGCNLSIRSLANGLWVSSEQNYTGANYGMLRARAAVPDRWETFNGCLGLRNIVNWKYVSAELNYAGAWYAMLRARADTLDRWEEFENSGP